MTDCVFTARVAGLCLTASAIASMITGCAGDKQVSFQSGGMTHTFAQGKDAVPKDFPLPLYPSATTTGSVKAEGKDEKSQFLMLSTADAVDRVSEYYQDKLKQQGWVIDDLQVTPPKLVSISAHLKEIEANVMIADDSGKTTISLSAGKVAENDKDDANSASEDYVPDKANPPTD